MTLGINKVDRNQRIKTGNWSENKVKKTSKTK